jgi:hypothetical protein
MIQTTVSSIYPDRGVGEIGKTKKFCRSWRLLFAVLCSMFACMANPCAAPAQDKTVENGTAVHSVNPTNVLVVGLNSFGHSVQTGTGRADPTQLPHAIGQIAPATTPVVSGGSFYVDPVSGVRVWRATSPTYPCSGNNGQRKHDYGDVAQISNEWGAGFHTLLIYTCNQYRLVDFNGASGFSNWRPFAPGAEPSTELHLTFSHNPATPRIAFIINAAGHLIRYNTATNQIANTGNFPRQAWGVRYWLQGDKNDRWFVANRLDGNGANAWNSQTNQSIQATWPGFDEIKLEANGRYAVLNTGNGGDGLWHLKTNTTTPFNPPAPSHAFHGASPQRFFTAVDVNSGGGVVPYYRMDPVTGQSTLIYNSAGDGYHSSFHHSGNWVNQDRPIKEQWFLISTYGDEPGGFLRRAIGFMKLDGSERRFLAHTYSDRDDYYNTPRAAVSMDGKIVVWDSNLRGGASPDVYVAEVPTDD